MQHQGTASSSCMVVSRVSREKLISKTPSPPDPHHIMFYKFLVAVLWKMPLKRPYCFFTGKLTYALVSLSTINSWAVASRARISAAAVVGKRQESC